MIPIHSHSPANRRGYHCRLRSFFSVVLSLGVPELVVLASCVDNPFDMGAVPKTLPFRRIVGPLCSESRYT